VALVAIGAVRVPLDANQPLNAMGDTIQWVTP
jgi:hypothetical protein